MRQQFEPAVIFSVYQRGDRAFFNESNHNQVLKALRECDVPFIELDGCYDGREEKSVLVPATWLENASVIARFHNQECILLLDNERGATISDLNTGEEEFVGWLHSVSKQSALLEDAWTRSGDYYYTISDCLLGGHLQR